jgi:F420H(2)-dependent quinone reductase
MAETSTVLRGARPYLVGSVIVWVAIWLGTAVVLRGQPGVFGAMVPTLAVGTVLGLGMPPAGGGWRPFIVQGVVWSGLATATAIVLSGTAYVLPELLVLGVGVVWYLAAAPLLLGFRGRAGRRGWRSRDLTKQIAALLTVRFHPAVIRAGGRVHLALFRLFRGAGLLGADTLVLTTRGRRSGRARSTPLYYVERDGAYFVAAGFAGSDEPPYWFTNLVADPAVMVQIGSRRIPCIARLLPDAEARPIWSALVALYPPFERYQARTRRRIPVIGLQPTRG